MVAVELSSLSQPSTKRDRYLFLCLHSEGVTNCESFYTLDLKLLAPRTFMLKESKDYNGR